MRPEDKHLAPPVIATLRDGRTATLRLIETTDAAAAGAFYAAVPRADGRFYLRPSRLTREEGAKLAAGADDPCRVVLVLDDGAGGIGGTAWYQWKDETASTSTFGICIARAWQGTGAGGALLDALFAIAGRVGPPRMALTVQKANARAVALYQKKGFAIVREQELGERDGFPAEPEYYMEKVVRPSA